ncbi:fimbrial protein, partial [uncultured Escherichia sp.]|uniref:fimbrial protein n=1 Tax=uncultured Escherichia sp. TaxID=237777 RepID=UPI00272AFC99
NSKGIYRAFPPYLSRAASPNSAEKIRWSTDEMQPDKGLEMTVALRETDAGQGVPGNFRALATFNFIYQ